MTADWRQSCRQCGKTPVKGRAWCRRCLDRINRGIPTDIDDVPKCHEQSRIACGIPDKPFPFWPSGY